MRRPRRGSALVFAVLLIFAITIVLLATQELAVNSIRVQRKMEQNTKARLALESGIAYELAEIEQGLIALPFHRTLTIDGMSVKVSVTDNSASVDKTVKVTATLTQDGQTFEESQVVGRRFTPSPWYYTIFVGTRLVQDQRLVLGSSGSLGDAYVKETSFGTGYDFIVNGDFETPAAVESTQLQPSSTLFSESPALTMPTINATTYYNARSINQNSSTLGGYGWLVSFGSNRPLMYREGNLTISGTFQGYGTIFVNGNLTIGDDVTVLLGMTVFIVTGDIEWKGAAGIIQGYYYTPGKFYTSGTDTRTLQSGAVVCGTLEIKAPTTIIGSNDLWSSPGSLREMYFPGHWP